MGLNFVGREEYQLKEESDEMCIFSFASSTHVKFAGNAVYTGDILFIRHFATSRYVVPKNPAYKSTYYSPSLCRNPLESFWTLSVVSTDISLILVSP